MTASRLNDSAPAPAAVGTTQRYDARGNPTDTTLPNTTYTYDEVGNLASVSLPNGVVTSYTYNPLNRLTLETVRRGTVDVARYAYDPGPDGRRRWVDETTYDDLGQNPVMVRTTWGYDAQGRLEAETVAGKYADTYGYDRAGQPHD